MGFCCFKVVGSQEGSAVGQIVLGVFDGLGVVSGVEVVLSQHHVDFVDRRMLLSQPAVNSVREGLLFEL